jgi:NADPH:quinone reductase-like Zn-dependent oxidoreductase
LASTFFCKHCELSGRSAANHRDRFFARPLKGAHFSKTVFVEFANPPFVSGQQDEQTIRSETANSGRFVSLNSYYPFELEISNVTPVASVLKWIKLPSTINISKGRDFMTTTMKAERVHSFGGPDVLQSEDIPRPEPKDDELLVHVRAAGVNPADWKLREGQLPTALPFTMGIDFAGVVEAVGQNVKEFRIGDSVLGQVSEESGSYAEYATAPASQVTRKPDALDDIQAAALPVAALTAWQALFDAADLQAGQKVLIHAAAGGVGSFAVQFAKWKGAYVIGTASTSHADKVRNLGADEVIDYHETRFENILRDIDVVLDTVGGDTQERSWLVLKPGGILVSLVQPPSQDKAAAYDVRGLMMRQKPSGDELSKIAELVASGRVKVNIETVLPLAEARKAQELSQSGHAGGKIVLKV